MTLLSVSPVFICLSYELYQRGMQLLVTLTVVFNGKQQLEPLPTGEMFDYFPVTSDSRELMKRRIEELKNQ